MNHSSKRHRRYLALVAALPLWVSILGCVGLPPDAIVGLLDALGDVSASFREVGTTKFVAEREPFTPKLQTDDRSTVYPGDRVKSTISPNTKPGIVNRSMRWTPPTNAGDFAFSRAPENPGGPPPFRWQYASTTDEVEITYTAFHGGATGGAATEVLEVTNDFQEQSSELTYSIRPPSPLRTAQTGGGDLRLPLPSAVVAPTAVITAWMVMLEVNAPITLTQQVCEAQQREDVYFALQLPVPPPPAPDEGVSLPLLQFDNSVSQFSIVAKNGAAWSTVLTNTLALRPTRIDALANNLPGGEDHVWIALGAASVKPCPEGLDIAEWKLSVLLFLDSASVPAGGYPFYLCADSEPVGPGAAPAQNCLGPQSLTLTDWAAPPPFNLSLSGSAVTTPTQTVQFAHQLRRLADGAISFTLENRSTLDGGAWAMFHDREYNFEPTAPDFTRPITPGQPLDLALNWLHFWVVKPIPADAAPGQYAVAITATQTGAAGDPWVATAHDTVLVAPAQMPPPEPPPCTPLTGLTLTHSEQRDALGHTFTITGSVTPPTATLPVSYTIQVDSVTQATNFVGGHAQQIVLTWEDAGAHTVAIAARACGQPEPLRQEVSVESQGRLETRTLYLPAIMRQP